MSISKTPCGGARIEARMTVVSYHVHVNRILLMSDIIAGVLLVAK